MMTKKTFDILTYLTTKFDSVSQRAISTATNMSVGTVNKQIAELTANGLVENGKITEKGLSALEPFRVRRAIFIAAGFGSRMVPVTLNTPKPLVRVKGKRIIDSLIDIKEG